MVVCLLCKAIRHLWSAEAVDFGEQYLLQVSRGKVSNKVDQYQNVYSWGVESRPTVPKFDNQQISGERDTDH